LVRLARFDYRRELGLLYGEGWSEDGREPSTPGAVRQAFARAHLANADGGLTRP
jgi:hypothetical protein